VSDHKTRLLYEELYRQFGPAAAWTAPGRLRVYRDKRAPGSAGLSPAAKAKLARIAGRAPEVMVKVSGRTRDGGHLREHMNYVTRNGEVAAETSYGVMTGKAAIADLHADWTDDEAIYRGQFQARRTALSVNMVLSMPPSADREAFKNAARDFTDAEIRPLSDAILAFHDDTAHPHAHVTVRGRRHDGRAFNPRPRDLEIWRERFAAALRNRGIEAEATPRFARGRTLKADRQDGRHMRARGLVPRVEMSAVKEAYEERGRRTGQGAKARPWETAAKRRWLGVRTVYAAAARELAASASTADRGLAAEVERFLRETPEPAFRRGLYQEALERQLAERRREAAAEKKRDGPERWAPR
jgi:type IV secretion system T-DNA border endonuclease VirD2